MRQKYAKVLLTNLGDQFKITILWGLSSHHVFRYLRKKMRMTNKMFLKKENLHVEILRNPKK